MSVPIHASDKSSVVTSFETGKCIYQVHRKYNKIPGTCAVYAHACCVCVVFLEYVCGALGMFKLPAFTYNQSWRPFRFILFLPEQAYRAAYAARGAKRLVTTYAKRVAAGTEIEEIAVPTTKRQDETSDVQIETEKREGREGKNKINQHQERKKEDSTQGEYAYFRLARSAAGV